MDNHIKGPELCGRRGSELCGRRGSVFPSQSMVLCNVQVTGYNGGVVEEGIPCRWRISAFFYKQLCSQKPEKKAVESGCQVVPKATPRWRTFEEGAQDSASVMLLGVI